MKVSEIIRIIQADGWYLVTTRGSHRQFKHSVKQGRVTVPGKPSDDLGSGTLNKYFEASTTEEIGCCMRYAIVIEKADGNFSAYVPDLPGCVATGLTVEETEMSIREAIEFHLDGMREDGLSIPTPSSRVDYVEVAA
jgi:predicted RNA binding protein YcfA (HicA-like mRNA interferase family)/predicted RNase H-like HicB family nuclease